MKTKIQQHLKKADNKMSKRIKLILVAAIAGGCALPGTASFATNTTAGKIVLVNDSTTTETFKVYGNCGMCKKTIEGSLKKVKGVTSANWNKETKMMEVTFNPKQITLDDIKKKIAYVGYDTDQYRATNKSYNGLPGCCQYERPEKK